MVRLAHFSDVHIFCPQARWSLRDWTSRRLAGWVNHRFLPRARLFRDAAMVLRALMADVQERRPDCVIFSGDATALGFQEEFELASAIMRVGDPALPPGLAVPGNHDYYTHHCAAAGYFEKVFQPWLAGERVDGATYPFARRVGHVYLIAVNSAKPNRWFWDATGQVGKPQLDRLAELLARPHIAAVPRILVTHYPICLSHGAPETREHGLLDLHQTLAVARSGGVSCWLHGHRHRPYQVLSSPLGNLPSICTGSGTQRDVWSYFEYAITGNQLEAQRRCYDAGTARFTSAGGFQWEI